MTDKTVLVALVKWVDSSGITDSVWHTEEQANKLQPVQITSIGLLQQQTAKAVTLVLSRSADMDVTGTLCIPIGAIDSITIWEQKYQAGRAVLCNAHHTEHRPTTTPQGEVCDKPTPPQPTTGKWYPTAPPKSSEPSPSGLQQYQTEQQWLGSSQGSSLYTKGGIHVATGKQELQDYHGSIVRPAQD